MSRIIQRSGRSTMPVAVAGDGCWIVDHDGRRYLDASGGAAVSCLGHGHPEVVEAIREQVGALAYAHTSFFSSEPAEELADHLVEHAPPGIEHVYFVSGGSEAVEAALKMARQYFVEIGQPQRRHFIARRQSYHGNTLGAMSVGQRESARRLFEPILLPVTHVSPCFPYRYRPVGESDEAYGQRLADELEQAILKLGADSVIGFLAETVGGATAGTVPPVPGYFEKVRTVCDRYGVLLMLDEVMCGMGRTGTLHACEQEGVVPDIMVVAKGLGAGYQPIGATLASEKVYRPILEGSGSFSHGHTYIGHPVACAAALAVQTIVQRDRLLPRVRAQGEKLQAALLDQLREHAHVGDVRGRGLFWSIELVADRADDAPFEPARRMHARVKAEAMRQGLCVYSMGGTIDGEHGDHVLLAPPFIVDDDEVVEIARRLRAAVDAAVRTPI
ncbi:MAG: aspartate aminotransferase family protein [Rhodocyclaceae bacterium]|nr:aspartate aminotransferase family protein [Rhodocyclaceae bacterium]MCA4901910.1 aspartate aminotransferase family protein [Rhodocyclaceae bacterium]